MPHAFARNQENGAVPAPGWRPSRSRPWRQAAASLRFSLVSPPPDTISSVRPADRCQGLPSKLLSGTMKRFLLITFSVLIVLAGSAIAGLFVLLSQYGRDLPDYSQLADYQPPTTTRIYAGDGRLLAEHALQHRLFVPIEAIPNPVIEAFLAAEDKNFYDHPGVDVTSVLRALVTNLHNVASDRRPVGGSTITQQVAKNFLLSNELSLTRKIKEAILAFRIERAFSKEQILELYLNEIYLGFGSYGVAAAAMNYFNKSLDDLTIAEAAFLAALPKAPNNYNPVTKPQAAKERRDWVIARMAEDGRITGEQAEAAWAEPLTVRQRDDTEFVTAQWFSEEVRRRLVERYGEKALYEGGLSVRTTLQPRLQKIADETLRAGLRAYDRRHGWRGPVARIAAGGGWQAALAGVPRPAGLGDWELAVVRELAAGAASIGLADGRTGTIPFAEMKWARPWRQGERVGGAPSRPADVLSVGDVVAVERLKDSSGGRDAYALRQIPAVDGALVALDPHTGRVLALSGGYSADRSEFNRATQARRQPGSAFKPFVYLAALENGFTPSSIVMDAPIAIDQGGGLGLWQPKNYSGDFSGPATLRTGVEKSRNLMTVRLADNIGIDKVATYAERFGVFDRMPRMLSMALGAGETTLLRLTAAYGMLANGGKRIEPALIDRVQDRTGRTIFRHADQPCPACEGPDASPEQVPELADEREQLADPASVYQMVSIMQGVVERGTGTAAKIDGVPLAGKTGTTNDSFDTWFVGFSSDLVVGVFVGFDTPRSLGPRETGGSVAAPIFHDYMEEALKLIPPRPFRVPPGVRLVRVSRSSGLMAQPGDRDVILEAFKPGTEPHYRGPVLGAEAATEATPEVLMDYGGSPYAPRGFGASYSPPSEGSAFPGQMQAPSQPVSRPPAAAPPSSGLGGLY